MNASNQVIKRLLNVLNKEYFVEVDEDCEEETIARNRRVALIISIEFCYAIDIIIDLIYLNKYGDYDHEHDLYQIKNLLVRSLIHMDSGGDFLVKIAFDDNLEWYVSKISGTDT